MSLSDFGVPTSNFGRAGILLPKTKDRFRVILTNEASEKTKNNLTQQVISVSMIEKNTGLKNFGFFDAGNEGRINLKVRDDVCNEAIDHIMAFKNGEEGTLTIDVLAGDDTGPLCSYVYESVKILSHKFDFDYSSAAAVYHSLILSFADWKVVKSNKP